MNHKYDQWVITPVNSIKKLVIDGKNANGLMEETIRNGYGILL